MTARRRERLDLLAERLRTRNAIQAQVIVADLTLPQAPQQIFDATEGAGLQVDVLINNAGFGEYGEFLRSNLEMQVDMVQVNCAAVVHLTRLFLPAMVERRRGAVMIVASTAAYQPVPYLATYGATKAFDRMLAEALAEEMKRYGVRVSALCPGPTESEFNQVAGARTGDKRKPQSAAEVARRGLEGSGCGQALGHSVPRWPGAGLCPAIRSATAGDRRGRADVSAGEPEIKVEDQFFSAATQLCFRKCI